MNETEKGTSSANEYSSFNIIVWNAIYNKNVTVVATKIKRDTLIGNHNLRIVAASWAKLCIAEPEYVAWNRVTVAGDAKEQVYWLFEASMSFFMGDISTTCAISVW